MKILYIGSERSDAQAVATALRGIDQAVAVSWASRLDVAERWLGDNRDLAALIVDAQIDEGWPTVLRQARDLAPRPAVVVVVPDGNAIPFELLHPGASEYIRRDQSLLRDLPVVVTRSIERAARTDLERKLAHAADQLAALQASHDASMAKAAATWEMVDEQLRSAALEVERARHEQAVLAERQRELEQQLAHEADERHDIEDALASEVNARDDAEKRHAAVMTNAAMQTRGLESTLRQARQDLESKVADLDRLAARELDLSVSLADISASRTDLERRLAATEAAFEDGTARATRERLTASKKAAEREAELDRLLQHERTTRIALEQSIADAEAALRHAQECHAAALRTAHEQSETALRDAQQRQDSALQDAQRRHDIALAAAATELAERQARLERELSQAAAAHGTLDRQLSQSAAERDTLGQQLSQLAAERDALARAVADATHAIGAASEREAELDRLLQRERAARVVLEQSVAEAEAALRQANDRHNAAQRTTQKRHDAALRDTQQRHDRALRDAQGQHRAELAAAAAELTEHQSRFDLELSLAAAQLETRRGEFDRQLADAATERDALTRHLTEANEAIRLAAGREAELDMLLQRERATRVALEQSVADAAAGLRQAEERHEAAQREAQQRHDAGLRDAQQRHDGVLHDARERHDAELAAAAAALAEHQVRVDRELSDAAAEHKALDRKLSKANTAIRKAAEREADLEGLLQQERATRAALEQSIADAEAAYRDAQARHEAAQRQAEERHEAVQRQAQDRHEEALRDAQQRHGVSLQEAHERHDVALAAAAADLIEHQARFERELSQKAAGFAEQRDRLDRELSHTRAEREALERQLTEANTAIRVAAERETELDGLLEQGRATRAALEQSIAEAETALRDAQERYDAALRDAQERHDASLREAQDHHEVTRQETQLRHDELLRDLQQRHEGHVHDAQVRHDAALAAAATELAEHQARFDRELSRTAAEFAEERGRLDRELLRSAAELDTLDRQLTEANNAIHLATEREAELDALLLQERAAREALEQSIADAEAALRDATARYEASLRDAQERHDASLRDAQDRQDVSQREMQQRHDDALQAAQQRHDTALAAAAADLTEHQTRFDRELSQVTAERDHFTAQLSDAWSALEQARQDYTQAAGDVERLTRREAELTSEIAGVQAERAALEQDLADTTLAMNDAQLRHEVALAAAATELAEHQARFDREVSQAAADRETLEQALSAVRARATEQRAQFDVQFARQQLEHERQVTELKAQVRKLHETLTASVEAFEASRAESHRLFDQAGLAMFRCTRAGALTEINRACATLIGRRLLDTRQNADFAETVFETPLLLTSLIERCMNTRTRESIEATWRRQDGSRLFVRLSARSLSPELVEVVAEDLTRVRVLEERLGQAERMEAVGRLASEIAVTCATLLGDVYRQGREWLVETQADMDIRESGDRLFDEVGRAAGLLHQLAACRDEQARTPLLVDLNTVVRDLEPVLKRVAGGDVEVQLRDTSSPLNVDVNTERVERLLVNLASYGRGRMPFGGRLSIELDTIVVDRHFAARHPNVRLGRHALITVTESRHAERRGGAPPRAEAETPGKNGAQRQGVDFATLQELVSECGGHLWMKVQPLGDMIAKIRLPLSSSNGQSLIKPAPSRVSRWRSASRPFQS
jgi:chromosome segregation ATPase